jgi:hypothetical protein
MLIRQDVVPVAPVQTRLLLLRSPVKLSSSLNIKKLKEGAYLAIQPCIHTVWCLLVDTVRALAGQLRSATSHAVCR